MTTRPFDTPESAALSGQAPRLKVAYVVSRFPRLTETFVSDEILAVERRGVTVDLYPLIREPARITHPEVAELVARARFLPFVSLAIVASQLYWLASHPVRYVGALLAALRGTWGSLNFFLGAVAIFPKVAHAARMMRAQGVTVVHCHFANHPTLAGFIIRHLTGIPYGFTTHGSDVNVDRHMLASKVADAAFVITGGRAHRELILRDCDGRWADKVRVLHVGVDTELFRPADKKQQTRTLNVALVGAVAEWKGHAHLIEACRLLVERGIALRCRMVGGGYAREVRRLVAAAGLDDIVTLDGWQPRPRIIDLHRSWTDVLVAPSIRMASGKEEGVPNVLKEAMACALPVVASDIGGVAELVEDGRTGLLVPPGDPVAIADALVRLLDPSLRDRLGRCAREKVVREFDLDKSADELVRTLSRVGGG